jgi:RNA-binding protein
VVEMQKRIDSLISKVRHGPATIRIGKAGITEGLIKEIKKNLEITSVIKVKILRSALSYGDRFELARKVAELVNAKLVEVRGRNFILVSPLVGRKVFKE